MRTIEPTAPAAAPEATAPPTETATAPVVRVVVVDDTPDLRHLLRLMLTRAGFDVVGEAADGAAAVEVVGRTQPDVVLLDVAMPRMDGIEALPQLRRTAPGAKVIAMSAFGAAHMANRAVAAGADGYVEKGTSLHSILDHVAAIGAATDRPAQPLTVTPGPSAQPATTPVRPAPGARTPSGTGVDLATLALEHAPYGVLVVSDEPAPRLVTANPAARRLLGPAVPVGGLLGLGAPALADKIAAHRHEDRTEVRAVLDGGEVLHLTLRRTEQGILVYLDHTGEELGMLRRAIAAAAHELRGPITAIDSAVDVLHWNDEPVTEPERDRLLRTVVRQVQHLDRITSDLYTATQIHLGTLHVDPRPVAVGALVAEVLADLDDVAVEVSTDRVALADPLRVEQILGNLVSNAFKYGAAPVTVVVRDGAHGTVDVEVVDRGPGIAPEFEPRLFHEFTRQRGSIARGTGLGLFVVRTLAEAQGGTATYRRHPEGGAVFTVRLPAAR